MRLYRPTDVLAANERWGASCGHAALAAIMRCEVGPIWEGARRVFDGRSWVSAPAMDGALNDLGVRWCRGPREDLPWRGLMLIQILGPWMAPGLPFGAQLAHTHWVAVDRAAPADIHVYDINADAWTSRYEWEHRTMTRILEVHKRATGWRLRQTYEVRD